MTNLVINAAAASILTPVALGIAAKLGTHPVTLLATCVSLPSSIPSATRAT
jgi:di/tricarboxylate transporter